MAKKSKIARNLHRKELVDKYRTKREELKCRMYDQSLSEEERQEAARQFRKIPRDASPTRIRLRCEVTGRPRGNYRKYGLCRIKFRELGHAGLIPGVTKSSW